MSSLSAQIPPPDSKSIAFDMTLSQILRINVNSGGNIEFVFNTMTQYKNGISNSAFYDTDIRIASSSNWQLHFGAESDLIATDDALLHPPLDKNNVGFTVTWTGDPLFCCGAAFPVDMGVPYFDALAFPNGLATFTGGAGDILFTNGTGNAGDVGDNRFTINWECGTSGAGTGTPMNVSSLLGNFADRYVTTVFLELEAL